MTGSLRNRLRMGGWTGERCVPWIRDLQIVYEHLHRYHFAAEFGQGRRVLDLASGEGYGSAIVARRAQHVVGVDLDPQSVAHSRAAYEAANLEFIQGSMLELDAFEDGEFGLVICFEAIEHIAEQAHLIAGVARVLAPDGIFLVSTPDRDAYNATIPAPNPFHVRELDRSELLDLLAPHFHHVWLWGQTGVTGSRLTLLQPSPDNKTATGEWLFVKEDATWREASDARPTFFIAAASREPFSSPSTRSYLLDPSERRTALADRMWRVLGRYSRFRARLSRRARRA